jgi:glycosyltransferase involved in cell wall biosynthesis
VIGNAGFVVEPEAKVFAETIKTVLDLRVEEKENLRLLGQQRVKELFNLGKNILQIEKVLLSI